jgi:hypothetical protein
VARVGVARVGVAQVGVERVGVAQVGVAQVGVARALAAALLIAAAVYLGALSPRGRIVQLPRGVIEIHAEMLIGAHTEVRGSPGTVLRAAADFQGRALIVATGDDILLRDFSVDGNRPALEVRTGLPSYDTPFARFTRANGVLAEAASRLRIQDLHFRNVAGFAILVSRSHRVAIDRVGVQDSGGRNAAGRNNGTGGILLEEGVTDFSVTNCGLRNIRGNGLWTHSLYTSPRNARGLIALNRFDTIGRDAIQVGHATDIRVAGNQGKRIGFPTADVDWEGRAIPVAIDTAGNVERCSYWRNQFSGIGGKCIDLDGFHDGEVRGNVCVDVGNFGIVMNNTNPDMQSERVRMEENLIDGALFGGIFVIGTGNVVARNHLLHLNQAHCNEEAAKSGCYYAAGEPDMLRSGIYLGQRAERPAPARGNLVEDNEITGFQMAERCIGGAPGIRPEWNTVRGNRCR